MTAGLDFRSQVDEIFEVRTGFHMHLHDQDDYLFYCSSPDLCVPISVDSVLIYERKLAFKGMEGVKWKMLLYPTDEFFDGQAELANLVGFIISLILSIALAVAFYFILSFYPKTRFIGVGLVIHMVLDAIDCYPISFL